MVLYFQQIGSELQTMRIVLMGLMIFSQKIFVLLYLKELIFNILKKDNMYICSLSDNL